MFFCLAFIRNHNMIQLYIYVSHKIHNIGDENGNFSYLFGHVCQQIRR